MAWQENETNGRMGLLPRLFRLTGCLAGASLPHFSSPCTHSGPSLRNDPPCQFVWVCEQCTGELIESNAQEVIVSNMHFRNTTSHDVRETL